MIHGAASEVNQNLKTVAIQQPFLGNMPAKRNSQSYWVFIKCNTADSAGQIPSQMAHV